MTMSMGILILEAHIVSAIDQTEYTSLLISFKLQSYNACGARVFGCIYNGHHHDGSLQSQCHDTRDDNVMILYAL